MPNIQKTSKGTEVVVFNDRSDDIRNICFEKITDDYSWGKYGEFKVMMMNDNGYINASKLCQDGGKLLKNWNRNKNARELEQEIKSAHKRADLKIEIMTGANNTRGTYVHPKLIPHIASWISPRFAITVADIVNEYFTKEALEEKDRILQRKDDKIDRILRRLDKQSSEMKEQTDKLDNQTNKRDKLLRRNRSLRDKVEDLNETANDLYDQNDELLERVDIILEDRVIKSAKQSNNPLFVLMKDDKVRGKLRYYVIRTNKRSLNAAITRYRRQHPNGKTLLKIDYNPNSINLWDRIKEQLKGKIKVNICQLGLMKGYTEKILLKDIKELNEERYE